MDFNHRSHAHLARPGRRGELHHALHGNARHLRQGRGLGEALARGRRVGVEVSDVEAFLAQEGLAAGVAGRAADAELQRGRNRGDGAAHET